MWWIFGGRSLLSSEAKEGQGGRDSKGVCCGCGWMDVVEAVVKSGVCLALSIEDMPAGLFAMMEDWLRDYR